MNQFLCTKPATLIQRCNKAEANGLIGLLPLTQLMFGTDSTPMLTDRVGWHTERPGKNAARPVHTCKPCSEGVSVALAAGTHEVGELAIPGTHFEDSIDSCTRPPVSYRPVVDSQGRQLAWEQVPDELKWAILEQSLLAEWQRTHYRGLEFYASQLAQYGAYEAQFVDGDPMVADFGRNKKLRGDISKDLKAKYFNKGKWHENLNTMIRTAQMTARIGGRRVTDIVFGPGVWEAMLQADAEMTKYFNGNCCGIRDLFSQIDLKPNLEVERGMVNHGTSLDGSVNLMTYHGSFEHEGKEHWYIPPGHMFMISRAECGYQGKRIRGPIVEDDQHRGDGVYNAPEIWTPGSSLDPSNRRRRKLEMKFRQVLLPLNPDASSFFQVLDDKAIDDFKASYDVLDVEKAA